MMVYYSQNRTAEVGARSGP